MRKQAVLLLFFMLHGCEKVESVCSITGGECCALSFSTDLNGNPNTPAWYQCVTDGKCPPDSFAGRTTYPTFPITNPPVGKCEVKYKSAILGMATSASADLAVGTLAAIKDEAIKTKKVATRTDGTSPKESDADYCAIQCSNPNEEDRGAFCQGATIENGVSLALLRLTAQIVKTAPTETKTIPIEDFLDEFKVPRESLSACPRSPVVIQAGEMINQGYGECESKIVVSNSSINLSAELLTPDLLRANLIKYKDVASFNPDDGTAFRLRWSGKFTDEYYGGPIISATQSRFTDTAVGIKGSHGVRCAAIEPEAVASSRLHEVARIANSNVSMVKVFSEQLKKADDSIIKSESTNETPILLPISISLKNLVAQNNTVAQNISKSNFSGSGESAHLSLRAPDLAMLVDISRCGNFMDKSLGDNYLRLLPSLGDPPSKDSIIERNKVAGELILCKYGKNLLSTEFNNAVSKSFGTLP